MKVVVDSHSKFEKNGNGRYISNLIKKIGDKVELVEFCPTGNKTLISKIFNYLVKLPLLVWKEKANVVYSVYFVPFFVNAKRVLMIHDVSFWFRPKDFSRLEIMFFSMVKMSIKKADLIIVPSKFTKSEIEKVYPEIGSKIVVIREGVDECFKKLNEKEILTIRKSIKVTERFYLVFGGKYKRRNTEVIIKAINTIDPNAFVVVVGEKRENVSGEKVKYVWGLSDNYLNKLLNAAEVVCYPSFYEGFGLPVIEAMKVGKPVLCSDIPALREVGGDAPFYFENSNSTSIEERLREILTEPNKLSQRLRRGEKRANKFSWDQCAMLTVDA